MEQETTTPGTTMTSEMGDKLPLDYTRFKPLFWTVLCWTAIPVCLLILHELTSSVSQNTPGWTDSSALSWIHEIRTPMLDYIFLTATQAGSAYVLLPTSVVWTGRLVSRGRQLDAWLLGLGLGGAMLMSQVAKALFSRPRPELFDPLIAMPDSGSFPSGHSTQITAFALCLSLIVYQSSSSNLSRLVIGLSIMAAACVGVSRIYLQVHYPSDVLAGGILAVLWVTGLYTLLNWIGNIHSSKHSLP